MYYEVLASEGGVCKTYGVNASNYDHADKCYHASHDGVILTISGGAISPTLGVEVLPTIPQEVEAQEVEVVEVVEAITQEEKTPIYEGNGYKITDGTREGAHEVYFDSIPSEAIRTALKGLKMRWNRNKGCWYGFVSEGLIKSAIDGETDKNPLDDYYTIDTTDSEGYMGGSAYRGSNSEFLYGSELTKALRNAFKRCGLHGVSVRKHTFSGGQSIDVTLKMQDGDIISRDEYINKYEIEAGTYWIYTDNSSPALHRDKYWAMDSEDREAIRQKAAAREYDNAIKSINGDHGVALHERFTDSDIMFTEQLKKRFAIIYKIVNSFNADSSNGMVDYFDRHFYDDFYLKA